MKSNRGRSATGEAQVPYYGEAPVQEVKSPIQPYLSGCHPRSM